VFKGTSMPLPGGWVDEHLLAGPADAVALRMGERIERGLLRRLVLDRQERLVQAGLRVGGAVAIHLPPSVEFITCLLAVWRAGAQAILLDHRFTEYEVASCLERLEPQFVVQPKTPPTGTLRGFWQVESAVVPRGGRLPDTRHALIQFSSGSTGPSKVIGRTVEDLVEEIDRYTKIEGFPGDGEQVVVLASLPHVLGLVGGLLNSLHTKAEMIVPQRMAADSILRSLASTTAPTVLLGVPSQAELLVAVPDPPRLPMLRCMITGGELVSDGLWHRFADRYGVRIGNMYGMTEAGVIATDVLAEHRPALQTAPGHELRVDGQELLLRRPESPYVGLSDPSRWVDGWLRTRDAGTVWPESGRIIVRGRLDSQVSISGLKVDLSEVEQTLAAAPSVAEAVVVCDDAIQAYVALTEGNTGTAPIKQYLQERLSAHKRPRAIYVLPSLPRTSSGKILRNPEALNAARLDEAMS
jgi:acyl-coenzyme A synthetase/AMP-(fatty) acid ligase